MVHRRALPSSPQMGPPLRAAAALSRWCEGISARRRHLVTLGVIGGGQPGVARAAYERLHGLAANLYKAQMLGKPLLVGEAGMTTCYSVDGSQVETSTSRAQKFKGKLSAFFVAGGAGYLIWAWEPSNSCTYAFTSGDPPNAVLKRFAAP
jgi:hypothetical protein